MGYDDYLKRGGGGVFKKPPGITLPFLKFDSFILQGKNFSNSAQKLMTSSPLFRYDVGCFFLLCCNDKNVRIFQFFKCSFVSQLIKLKFGKGGQIRSFFLFSSQNILSLSCNKNSIFVNFLAKLVLEITLLWQ